MAMNSSIKNSRLLITGTLLHHKHQLRDFFNRYGILQQLRLGVALRCRSWRSPHIST